MCTVTFIPLRDGFLMSSNRDENPQRKLALLPQVLMFEDYQCIVPVDGAAGGTWMGLRNDGAVVILLNGAFTNHKRNPPYQKSRGLVVTELLQSQNMAISFLQTDLSGIEPFSLVVWQHNHLHHLVWDGLHSHHFPLDCSRAHIWSSATLYDAEIHDRRREEFYSALASEANPDAEWLENFLCEAMPFDEGNRFVMRRGELLGTLSISIISASSHQLSLKYIDLMQQPSQAHYYHLPLPTHHSSQVKHEHINQETLVH